MAVSYDDVVRAADALIAAGEKATLRGVRTALGGGSFTSIAPLLRQWDLTRLRAAEPSRLLAQPVYKALELAAPAIWEAAFAAASEQHQPQLAAYQSTLAEQLERQQEQAAIIRGLEQDLEQHQARNSEAVAEQGRLTAELSTLTGAHHQLSETNAELSSQLRLLEERRSTIEHERAGLRTTLDRERELRAEQERALDQALSEAAHLRTDQDRMKQELRSERTLLATHAAEHKAREESHQQMLAQRDLQLAGLSQELSLARSDGAERATALAQAVDRCASLATELTSTQALAGQAAAREQRALDQEREAREAHRQVLQQYSELATGLGERLQAIQLAVATASVTAGPGPGTPQDGASAPMVPPPV